MNIRELRIKIEGINLLHSKVVEKGALPGLESLVLELVREEESKWEESMIPEKMNLPLNITPIKDSTFYLFPLKEKGWTKEKKFNSFRMSKALKSPEPTPNEIIDFMEETKKEVKLDDLEDISDTLYTMKLNPLMEIWVIVLPLNVKRSVIVEKIWGG